MKTYLGEKGLGKSWQTEFPKSVKCHKSKCKGNCRIMFVAFEDQEKKYICDLHENMEDDKYWPHDAIACAVYLCEKCFTPNTLLNQA